MAAMTARRLGDVILVVQSSKPPSDGEWQAFDALWQDASDAPFLRMLVVTAGAWLPAERPPSGATPSAHRQKTPVAVVGATANATSDRDRAGFNTRRYLPEQALDALVWLAIDGSRSRAMLRELPKMAAMVGDAELARPVVQALKDRAATPGTLAIDAERFRIARDLHDGLCNSLAGLHMRLGVLTAMNPEPALGAELAALSHQLEEVLNDLRTMAWSMRVGEPTWEQLSLYLHKRLEEVSQGQVDLSLDNRAATNRVPRDLAHRLIHELQIAAADVAGVGSTRLRVTLQVGDQRLRVEVTDPAVSELPWALELAVARVT